MEPTKAEKQIAIDAARRMRRIYCFTIYIQIPKRKTLGTRRVWRVIPTDGHAKDFSDEYEAALYILKQELMR